MMYCEGAKDVYHIEYSHNKIDIEHDRASMFYFPAVHADYLLAGNWKSSTRQLFSTGIASLSSSLYKI